jgi:hypothetical protein
MKGGKMKRMFILALAILHLLTMTVFVTGCGDQREIYRPIDDPGIDTTGTPPGDPPPDPPPPPGNLSSASGSLASSTAMSLEVIAQKVLEGDYGTVLQRILADEISKCVNQMGEEGVVLITPGDITSNIRINEDSKGQIMFDSSYIADEIISGDYGSEAKEVLSVFIKKSLKR